MIFENLFSFDSFLLKEIFDCRFIKKCINKILLMIIE